MLCIPHAPDEVRRDPLAKTILTENIRKAHRFCHSHKKLCASTRFSEEELVATIAEMRGYLG